MDFVNLLKTVFEPQAATRNERLILHTFLCSIKVHLIKQKLVGGKFGRKPVSIQEKKGLIVTDRRQKCFA